MNQREKARHFAELHIKGKPVVLYNAWDTGTAKAILAAGAQAIATSSWSVAEAQGYGDGEAIPFDFAHQIVARIAATVDAPVTVDFRGATAMTTPRSPATSLICSMPASSASTSKTGS